MKFILTIFFFCIAHKTIAQKPYPTLFIDNGTLPCDQIKFGNDTIKPSNRIIYYNYAIKLSDNENSFIDSVNKAGQIFDRIYRIDTASEIGINALAKRTAIETQLIAKIKICLLGTWQAVECIDPWGENMKTAGRKIDGQVTISENEMEFVKNQKRETIEYDSRYYFNWDFFASTTIMLLLKDSTDKLYISFRYSGDKPLFRSIILEKSMGSPPSEYPKCYRSETNNF